MIQPADHGNSSWTVSRRTFLQTTAALTVGVPLLASGTAAQAATGGQWSWRWCKKCEGLFYAGVGYPAGPCAGGGSHNHTGSANYGLDYGGITGTVAQGDWGYCKNCQELFYTKLGSGGVCPAGGKAHDSSGIANYNYVLFHDASKDSDRVQTNWRYCKKCQGLAFGGDGQPGLCPAGARHDHSNSFNYALEYCPEQPSWRFCRKCYELVYGGFPTTKACGGGGQHDVTGSWDYKVPHDVALELPNSQGFWLFCSRCYCLYNDSSPAGAGVCPANGGRSHQCDNGGMEPWHYLMFTGTVADGAQQTGWKFCGVCAALVYGGYASQGRCPHGGVHNVSGSLNYVLDVASYSTGTTTPPSTPPQPPSLANLIFSGASTYVASSNSIAVPFKNSGSSTTNPFAIRVILDSASSAYYMEASLGANQSDQLAISLDAVTAGQHVLVVVLDALNQVGESQENDNTKTIYFTMYQDGSVLISTP